MSFRLQFIAVCLLFLNLLSATPGLASGPTASILVPPLDQTVLNQGTALFTVVATSLTTMSYQWFKDGVSINGATGSTLSISGCRYTDQGVYVVKITNGGGTISSSGVTLTILGAPAITTQPVNQIVTQSQNASFSILANGTATLKYQWNFNGTALAGATGSALTLNSVHGTNAGNYTVVVTNAYGMVTSAVATLTVYLPPTITTQPQSQTVVKHQDVSFSVAVSGTAPYTYSWYYNGSSLGGSSSPTYILSTIKPENAGNYMVVVANAYGSVTSAVATLTVIVPPSITTQPQSQTLRTGKSATLGVIATGTAPLSYQWSFNGTARPGATGSSLSLTNIQASDAGNYTVIVTNAGGLVTSAAATLTATNLPSPTLSVSSSEGMTANGFRFHFSAPAGSTYVILTSTSLQNWIPIATNITQDGNVTFTDAAASNYPTRLYRASVQ